jgi:hypothetical protein
MSKAIKRKDGLWSEERIIEKDGEKIIETYVEKRPMELTSRIIEKTQPVVVERKVEHLVDGKVVDTEVESLSKDLKKNDSDESSQQSNGLTKEVGAMQSEVAERVIAEAKKMSLLDMVLVGLIVVQAAVLLYFVFNM